MLTPGRRDPSSGAGLTLGVLGVLVNVMICGSFGFDRSKDFGGARGPKWCIAIGNWTRHYNIASTTVQQVIKLNWIITRSYQQASGL
ncbi:MAG: hypothetical protein EAZ96_27025 [Oscillatoriales cyanobacterium]|nr:MAG: hypothetical protein EAZ96_27025 [Oscillatoriales cyanobacterium]